MLSKMLGHKDLKMTQRYAKLSSKFIEGERGRMDTIWTPPPIPMSEDQSQTQPKSGRIAEVRCMSGRNNKMM